MVIKRFEKAVFTGVGVVLAASTVLLVTHIAMAQPPADATYKGMRKVCLMCHKVTHKDLTEAFLKTAHPVALQDAKEAGAIVADFNGAPFKKEDVKWVLGKGFKHQAYIGADGKLLPAEWLTKDKKWKEVASVDAMKECVPCHVTGFRAADNSFADTGVTCESCHGPGSAHAAAPTTKGNIGQNQTLAKDREAMVCGQCHAQGVAKDGVSKYPVGYKWGDDLNKSFTLAAVKDVAPNQQYNEWLTSKHAVNSIVVCTDCHEVHGAGSSNEHMLKKPQNELCGACHAEALAKPEHPKVTGEMKCSMCHMPGGKHTFTSPGRL